MGNVKTKSYFSEMVKLFDIRMTQCVSSFIRVILVLILIKENDDGDIYSGGI